MRVSRKGQVTIPRALREAGGLRPGCEVELRLDGDALRLVPLRPRLEPGRAAAIVHRRRGSGTIDLSTDAILALMRGEG